MNGFKFHKGMGIPYERQGYVYFVCRAWDRLSRSDQAAIVSCAQQVCGDYAGAVIQLVTTGDSYQRVAWEHHMGINTLYRWVAEFYRRFPL